MAAIAYRVLAGFLRLVTRVFFRQIEVVGLENVPAAGPVLFAGNHPNSLIDPILIITTCGRKVHFAAKDALFKGPIMRALLRGLGAVPVARKVEADGPRAGDAQGTVRDAGERGKVNDAAFEHMFGVLEHGGTIGIFPEGISHDEAQLARLKTGAARLALGGAARANRPIAVVPCGLTFIHPKRFRSRVLVQYGAPLLVEADADPGAVPRVTSELDGALRRLTINAPDWDTVRALDTVRRLYQPQEISIEERVELARRFNTYYGVVEDKPEVRALMERVRAYQDKLDDLGVSDRELARDLSKREVTVRLLRHLVLVLFWLPLCLPGAPLHLPTVAFARIAGPRLTPRKDVIATTKLLVGMMLVLLSYAVVVALLGWKVGLGAAVAAGTILPLSGWATLRVLDRVRLVRRAFGVLARRFAFRDGVRALRAERYALAEDVIRTVAAVTPADVVPLFPRSANGLVEESDDARHAADLDDEFAKDER